MTERAQEKVASPHIPVLLDAVLQSFDGIDATGTLIDCTLGYAGHSEAILRAHPGLRLLGIDRDPEALAFSQRRLAPYAERVRLLHGSFSELLPDLLARERIVGILADFGVSSLQLDHRERGFSFESETLDMRMNPQQEFSAETLVNSYPMEELERIFRDYGEIRPARRLAEAIVKARSRRPIRSGRELAAIVESVLPRRGRIHPATQPFQAIRIAVNDELGEIDRLLDTLEAAPPSGAIVSLITFHSLEDRRVKNRFRDWSRDCICPPGTPRCLCGGGHALGRPLQRKAISASPEEAAANPRSRSAKLRSFRFREKPEQGNEG
ncbi:16S rRNA (cytosine(1402)-N(4))-methyltransferase RsmH [Nitratifractor sp.]